MSVSLKRKCSDSDPGLWFPLLKGFFQRVSSSSCKESEGSDSNCGDHSHKNLSLKALSAFQAERIISSWLHSILQKKRQGDKYSTSHFKQQNHFLLRALTSSSLPVRRLAACIILDATNPMAIVRATLNQPKPFPDLLDPTGRVLLRDMFWTFAKNDVEDMVSYAHSSNNNLNLYYPYHDGIIQIYGVLAHLIFDDDGAWYAYSYSCNREDDSQIAPFYAVEHFICSGGLRWITASLLRLISAILREEGYAGFDRLSSTDTSFTEAVQLRIILLVDLCSRLFMHVALNPIQFPVGYWQSVLPLEHSHSETLLESEKNKIISRMEKKRKDFRVRTLYCAFHLLWSSKIPAVTAHCSYNMSGSSLSPLACLIACYAVLRIDDHVSIHNFSTSEGITERNNSTNQDADQYCFKNFFEIPVVTQRLDGMTQVLDCLQKMIDPIGHVFFTAATYPPTPRIDSTSKAQIDSGKVEPTTIENRGIRKRSHNVLSTLDNIPNKKMNVEVVDEVGNAISEAEHAATSMLLEDVEVRNRLLQSNESNQKKNDYVIESNGVSREDEEEDEVPEEEYGNDDGMIDVDDEVDEESVNDECSDYDPSELAGCNRFDSVDDDLKAIGNQSRVERLSLSEASMFIIPKAERDKALIRASMEVLHAHYGYRTDSTICADGRVISSSNQDQQEQLLKECSVSRVKRIFSKKATTAPPLLTISAEQFIIGSICNIVKPPPKPFKMKIVMKRQPSQEEFFRGSLSKNPINLESLCGLNSPSRPEEGDDEPRVRDLRLYIARDLKMEDSAELLELIVGNKILGLGLKLRVVCQVVWKKYVMEKATSSSAGFSSSFLSSSFLNRRAESAPGLPLIVNPFNDLQKSEEVNLPPMIVTYRLIGVDGEATEERVEDGDLLDPEAPCETCTSNAENEKNIEIEYGLTKIVTDQRGIQMLLKSTERYLTSCIQSIRRDNVTRKYHPEVRNTARELFLKSKLCPSLVLLRHCARLKENRAKMVKSRAPTKLLRMLLDLLSCIEDSRSPFDIANKESPSPVAKGLQELIEALSSVIAEDIVVFNGENKSCLLEEDDDGSLQLLLSSLRTTMLSSPLRAVISKLLPYLTYGQVQLSRDLASDLVLHVQLENLGTNTAVDNMRILMDTFVDCAMHLPPTPLFHPLRMELLRQNFVLNLIGFILQQIPDEAPHWCPALVAHEQKVELEEKTLNENKWRVYFNRQGLTSALRMLIGLATNHYPTQLQICGIDESSSEGSSTIVPNHGFLGACHWIESISDFKEISTYGLGIQAETLLDILSENKYLSTIIANMRNITRDRKKVIANERRKALMALTSFASAERSDAEPLPHALNNSQKKESPTHRSTMGKSSGISEMTTTSERLNPAEIKSKWQMEVESIEDENGLTCVVCQEGRKVQPKELLGLYAYAKRVVLSSKTIVSSIDGTDLLCSLPRTLPSALLNTPEIKILFDAVSSSLQRISSSKHDKSISKNDRILFSLDRVSASSSSLFLSTVSAGNAIHCTCHLKARVADKNHSKAAKSEWEGATLRNSRITCNLILPLVSASVSHVPKYVIDSCIVEYTTQIVGIAGSQPKSILWLVLFDVRFLLLRFSYGESITQDCGGGSLRSNALLMMYMLMMGNTLKEKEADAFIHASALPHALLLSSLILRSKDTGIDATILSQIKANVAEATPIAAIVCILFYNGDGSKDSQKFWFTHRDYFFSCFMYLSGYRYALGIEGSGCESLRNSNTSRRLRSTSFHEWESGYCEGKADNIMTKFKSFMGKRSSCRLDEYSNALRPMITMFIILDNLARVFAAGSTDDVIDQSSIIIGDVVESCQRVEDLDKLLSLGSITMDKEKIFEAFNQGLSSCKRK